MPQIMELLEWQRSCEYISISSSILVLIAAILSERIEVERKNGNTYKPPFDSAMINAASIWIALIGRLWLTRIAMIRLIMLAKRKKRGRYKGSLGPNEKNIKGLLGCNSRNYINCNRYAAES